MHTLTRQWMKALLLTLLTAVWCSGRMLAADISHTDDDGDKPCHCHAVIHSHEKVCATTLSLHESARVCSSAPVRTTNIQQPSPTQRLLTRSHKLFDIQKTCFCNYRGQGSILSSPIMPLPACEYYIFTLRRLLC